MIHFEVRGFEIKYENQVGNKKAGTVSYGWRWTLRCGVDSTRRRMCPQNIWRREIIRLGEERQKLDLQSKYDDTAFNLESILSTSQHNSSSYTIHNPQPIVPTPTGIRLRDTNCKKHQSILFFIVVNLKWKTNWS